MSILLNSNLSELNDKTVYKGIYSAIYANGSEFSVAKKGDFVIFSLNANFEGVPNDWVQIGKLNNDEVRPSGDYIYSIPCMNLETFQIMVGEDLLLKARYTGGTSSTPVVQDTLVWLTSK